MSKESIVKRLFVSTPMNNRDDEDVWARMLRIWEICNEVLDDDYDLIDQLHRNDTDLSDEEIASYNTPRIWYLGRALQYMSDADLIIFDKDWEQANGCIIEHVAAVLYKLKIGHVVNDDKIFILNSEDKNVR